MRVQFEATIDDFADAMFRAGMRRHPNFQGRISEYLFVAFILSAFATMPIFLYFSWEDAWIGVVTFFIMFTAYLYFHRPTKNHYKKLCYEIAREKFDGVQTAIMGIELTEKGLSTQILGDDSTVAWKNIVEIEETEKSIYFFCRDTGACFTPKRALVSTEQTARFLAIAKTYHQSAQQFLNA